jgi:hypothetical protein
MAWDFASSFNSLEKGCAEVFVGKLYLGETFNGFQLSLVLFAG